MGIASDFPTAFGKAQAAAGVSLPTEGTIFISVTDSDKPAATQLATRFHDLGFEVIATSGTAQAISAMGVPVRKIKKIGEGSPNVVDCIRSERGRPGDQHPDRVRRAHRRLRDPHGGDPARNPVRDHDDRRLGGLPRDLRRRPGATPRCRRLQELHHTRRSASHRRGDRRRGAAGWGRGWWPPSAGASAR